MLLSAMKELLEMRDWQDWDFVLNLSESDYPVKTQTELVQFLSTNREGNFVKVINNLIKIITFKRCNESFVLKFRIF